MFSMDRADLEQWKGREVARLLALVETERRYYQEIVASIPVGLAVLSADRSILSANRAFRHTFGIRAEDLRRKTVDQLLPSELLRSKIAEAISTGAPQHNLEIHSESGDRRLRASVLAIRNWDEETELEALLVLEDLTGTTPQEPGQTATESAPQITGRRIVPLPEIPAIMWAANPATLEFTFVEGDTNEVFGYPPEHWTSTSDFWMARIYNDDRESTMDFYRDAIRGGGRHACEYRVTTADNRIVWCRDSFRVVLDEHGTAIRMTGVLTDVTDRRRTEQQAIQAERMDAVMALSKSLTHDLNNPLMIVTGYGEELLSHLPESDPARDDMAEILNAGERMSAITNQLLTFTRKQAAPTEEMDVAAVVREVGSRAGIDIGGCASAIWATADRDQLQHAITALAARLHRYSTTTSEIHVSCATEIVNEYVPGEVLAPGSYADILLAINAPVPSQAQAFESLLPGKDPTGPEIAKAYAIVREWGGCISQTQSPEGHAEFHVYLPAVEPPHVEEPAEAETAAPEPEAEPQPEPEPEIPELETVLVVEDEGGIRALVRKILRRQGYHVLEAGTPDEAIATARAFGKQVDLLVTDMTLPQRNGRALAEDLKAIFPDLKVLYVSGYTDDATVYAGDLPPGAAFLQKPFTLGSLLKKVRDVLDSGD